MLVAPRASRSWLGDVVDMREVRVAVRCMGVRDLAIGAGTLRALNRGEPVRLWLTCSAAADLVDATATLGAISTLPRRALGTVVLAAGAAALSIAGRQHVD